ncbi:11582_t:CDS:2 [Acaulospora morrowiae]|uniref:11582_t:CDS:1 n=1 Tax=Acaulospora morrowiae TaxID=94023 RepID=A0A9N9AES4_9GLOM|nr:11582_t:CDS:2 [Acaulospora morrowiae]
MAKERSGSAIQFGNNCEQCGQQINEMFFCKSCEAKIFKEKLLKWSEDCELGELFQKLLLNKEKTIDNMNDFESYNDTDQFSELSLISVDKQKETSKDTTQSETHRICISCGKKMKSLCNTCVRESFSNVFSEWTSGNAEIDAIIRESQSSSQSLNQIIEWIPFENFQETQSTSYTSMDSTIWADGPIKQWDEKKKIFKRKKNFKVTLKFLESEGFLEEG